MKKIFNLVLVLVATLVVIGIASGTQAAQTKRIDFANVVKPKTTITVWVDDEDGEYMKEIVKAFNVKYPSINIDFTHKGSVDSREALKTFGPSGNGCDVFQFPHDQLATAIKEDLVYSLSNELKDELALTLNQTALDIATVSYDETTKSFTTGAGAVRKLFAVPMSVESVFLYYNKDLVTEQQASSFTTFENIEIAAKTWQTKNPGSYYLGTTTHWADSYFVQFALSADGGDGWRPFGVNGNDKTSVGYANTVNQLTWMTNHLKPITTGSGNHDSISGGSLFEQGKMPLVLGGPWNVEAFNAAEGLNFGAIEIPTIAGQQTKSYTGAIMAAVYKKTTHPEEATKFVKFLASEEAMALQYEYKTKLPALKETLFPENVKSDEILMVMANQLTHTYPMPTIPSVTNYWGPGETMIKSVWNEGTAPATAVGVAEAGYASLEGLGQ